MYCRKIAFLYWVITPERRARITGSNLCNNVIQQLRIVELSQQKMRQKHIKQKNNMNKNHREQYILKSLEKEGEININVIAVSLIADLTVTLMPC